MNIVQPGGTSLDSTTAAVIATSRPKWVSTATQTIQNSSVETSIIGTGFGNLTIGANTTAAGITFFLNIFGTYSTRLVSPGTITFRVKSGGTSLAQAVLQNLPVNISSAGFEIRGRTVVRSIGVNGTTMASGVVNYLGTSSVKLADDFINQGATINTTVDRAIDVTAQWQNADSANVLTISQVFLTTSPPP